MSRLIRVLVGGIGYILSPKKSGAIYLRGQLRRARLPQGELPAQFYRDASRYAYDSAIIMASTDPRETRATHFVDHLDYLAIVVEDALNGDISPVSAPLREIFERYGVPATAQPG
ncbi:MAG: hypothetical protein QM639_15960 [Rhodocyclaceae bacterium]